MITRETDYALRLLRALSDGELHTVGELTQRTLAPRAFAYKILKKLEKAGLVQVLRGSDGGCLLCGDLEQVSLLELMNIMGENITLNACMTPGYHCPWSEQNGSCSVHCGLASIQKSLELELGSHSLRELLNS